MTSTRADARINVRLPGELKQTIEEAAAAQRYGNRRA
jgi:Arc/MetJ-type ribon-helix-helix transcriptional regulator